MRAGLAMRISWLTKGRGNPLHSASFFGYALGFRLVENVRRMDPVILPNTISPVPFLLFGIGLIAGAVYCQIKNKLDRPRRFGMAGVGLLVIIMSFMTGKSQIELHQDKIVYHKVFLGTKTTTIDLRELTRVVAVSFQDGDDEKELWLFSRGDAPADTILIDARWRSHEERIIEHLAERGVVYSRRKAK